MRSVTSKLLCNLVPQIYPGLRMTAQALSAQKKYGAAID